MPLLITSLLLPDDQCDLKAETCGSPTSAMDNLNNHQITAKERGVLETDNEKEQMDREEEEEEGGEERKRRGEEEEKDRKEEEDEPPMTEERELEELRSQVLHLFLELDEARESSNKHQESFHELQGDQHAHDFLKK